MGNHSDSWQLCFSLKIPFWEAHPFSEIFPRLHSNFSASFYLSISLIYFRFLCSGGRECPFHVVVAFSVNCGFMLFVQHLAERGLCSCPGLCYHSCAEGIMLLLEYHWCRELGKAGGSMCSQLLASVGEVILIYSCCPLQEGRKRCWEGWAPLWGLGEVAAGKHHTWVLALWGEAAATQRSPTQSGPKGPPTLNKISVREAVLVHVTVGLVGVVNILDNLNIRSGKRRFFLLYCILRKVRWVLANKENFISSFKGKFALPRLLFHKYTYT